VTSIVSRTIQSKLDQVAADENVRKCLDALLVFEVDQDDGGIQYKREYRTILERHAKVSAGEGSIEDRADSAD
jgi:hypothetical protein